MVVVVVDMMMDNRASLSKFMQTRKQWVGGEIKRGEEYETKIQLK